MELSALRSMIGETVDDDWNRLDSGPYYHDAFGQVFAGGQEAPALEHRAHLGRAVFALNVDVALEWGMDVDGDDGTVTIEGYGWGDEMRFPDKRLRRMFIDVFYGGSVVDRLMVLDVDGGRCTLPIANRINGVWSVEGWEYDIVRLVDSLSGHQEFDRYFERTRWTVLR